MNKASYPHRPICKLESLSKVLGVDFNELLELSKISDDSFFVVNSENKADGSTKYTYDAKPNLKKLHQKINNNILKKVNYPNFLKGSLKGISYINNVECHTNKNTIISEDIKSFFPNISYEIVYQIWVSDVFNFSHEVAECLTNLTTYKGALVQGASTSSFIANLVIAKRTVCFTQGMLTISQYLRRKSYLRSKKPKLFLKLTLS